MVSGDAAAAAAQKLPWSQRGIPDGTPVASAMRAVLLTDCVRLGGLLWFPSLLMASRVEEEPLSGCWDCTKVVEVVVEECVIILVVIDESW